MHIFGLLWLISCAMTMMNVSLFTSLLCISWILWMPFIGNILKNVYYWLRISLFCVLVLGKIQFFVSQHFGFQPGALNLLHLVTGAVFRPLKFVRMVWHKISYVYCYMTGVSCKEIYSWLLLCVYIFDLKILFPNRYVFRMRHNIFCICGIYLDPTT